MIFSNNLHPEAESWNSTICKFPEPHILQTEEWGRVKSQFGWEPHYKTWQIDGSLVGAALILLRRVKIGFLPFIWRVMYVPKGPLLVDWSNRDHREMIFNDLKQIAKENRAIFVKIDPDIISGYGLKGEADYTETEIGKEVVDQLSSKGWVFSNEQIQFRNTMIIDLSHEEDVMLSNMKQKARYNLRLAGRKGVVVRKGDEKDFDLLYEMFAETSKRDGFIIRDKYYYSNLWDVFYKAGLAQPLIAEFEGEAIAAMILFHLAGKSWFLTGMSTTNHRDKMPNYLLQWEAIQLSKKLGCLEYDLWGAPNENVESDPLFNVYRFKQGLGGRVVRHIGAWDLPIKPFQYRLYTQLLPKILALWRWQSRKQSKQFAD